MPIIFAPVKGTGKKTFTSNVTITPGQIGGEVNAYATTWVTLGRTKPAIGTASVGRRMRLDARRSPSLTAAIQVMHTDAERSRQGDTTVSKAVIQPEWRKGLAERAPGERVFHDRLVASAAYVSDSGVKLVAGRNGS